MHKVLLGQGPKEDGCVLVTDKYIMTRPIPTGCKVSEWESKGEAWCNSPSAAKKRSDNDRWVNECCTKTWVWDNA